MAYCTSCKHYRVNVGGGECNRNADQPQTIKWERSPKGYCGVEGKYHSRTLVYRFKRLIGQLSDGR